MQDQNTVVPFVLGIILVMLILFFVIANMLGKKPKAKKVKKQTYFGEEVWVNLESEARRETECLCLQCAALKPGQPDNCPHAQYFYEGCVKANCAFMMTRCRDFKTRELKEPEDNSHWNIPPHFDM